MKTEDLAKIIKETRDNAKASPIAPLDAVYNAMQKLGYIKDKSKAVSDMKLQKAIAEHYRSVDLPILMEAKASKRMHTVEIDMVITPLDKGNSNKQGIPSSEKENIITSAQFKPVRANFTGLGIKGHKGAKEVGVITNAWHDNNTIYATGTIWTEKDTDLEEYLLDTKQLGGSWEVYYARSEQRNGIEWLYDTVFAAQCLVERPAYGADTPITVK
jgi:hypothetical protein